VIAGTNEVKRAGDLLGRMVIALLSRGWRSSDDQGQIVHPDCVEHVGPTPAIGFQPHVLVGLLDQLCRERGDDLFISREGDLNV
jgi:hypothetical protein